MRGGRAGPTFHDKGGRGGRTNGAKRSVVIDILGLPLAVSVESARRHDVSAVRRLLEITLPALGTVRAIVADLRQSASVRVCDGVGVGPVLVITRPESGARSGDHAQDAEQKADPPLHQGPADAMAESFFATLEVELIDRSDWATPTAAREAVFEYIEVFYNRIRRHSGIGQQSPEQFEDRYRSIKATRAM